MQRRQFLAATGTVAVAGCSFPEAAFDQDEEDGHPFAGDTLAVRVEVGSATDHDLTATAREALSFWDANAREYTGFEVGFELAEDDDPDVVIRYTDTPRGCEDVEGYSQRVLGCAPLVRAKHSIDRPVTARVVAGTRPLGGILVTTKHELGHVLGLGHGDEPRRIMSNRPEDRIPMYQVRADIWETINDAQQRGQAADGAFEEGRVAWRDEAYDRARERFGTANSRYGEMQGLVTAARDRTDEFSGEEVLETIELATLRTFLERLQGKADAAAAFSRSMIEASRAAANGETERANESLETANQQIREFNGIDTPQMREIAIALGLVRGFDRDDEVVDSSDQP